jgi:hypothetical protein
MSKQQTKEEGQEKCQVYEKEDRRRKFKIFTRELEMGMKLSKTQAVCS